MIPTGEMMIVLTPTVMAMFVGIWILLTMGWVINVDEIAQARRRRAAREQADYLFADAPDASGNEGLYQDLNQVVPDSDDSDNGDPAAGASVSAAPVPAAPVPAAPVPAAPVPVPEHVLIAQAYESLFKTVEEEKAKTERMQKVIYQILGGLYNQRTQSNRLQFDLNYLYDNKNENGSYETEEDVMLRDNEPIGFMTYQGTVNSQAIRSIDDHLSELSRRMSELENGNQQRLSVW